MAKNAVEIGIWKAVHTSGTKFYQIVRFVAANGHSFSIRHYGKVELFTGMGKIATGAIELDENFKSASGAGLAKRTAKAKDGYLGSLETTSHNCSSVADAVAWIRTEFGKKAQDIARPILLSNDWKGADAAATPAAPAPVSSAREPEISRAELLKNEDYGSW